MFSSNTSAANGAANYIEDVFSTYLYTNNTYPSNLTITNGIDLSGKGGLVWMKNRNLVRNHNLYDTARGAYKQLRSDSTGAEITNASGYGLTAFNADGFSLGTDIDGENYGNVVSWTFRKQKKFFDVVTYSGNSSTRTISHSLASAPGMIIIKRTTDASDWWAWHRTFSANEYVMLNSTAAKASGANSFISSDSTGFTIGSESNINGSGNSYVAYLFAHNAGGFGLTGTDNVISCGSYTGNGSTTGPTVTLGYEPQWLLVKKASDTADWLVYDNMRNSGSWGTRLNPNLPNAENSNIYAQFEITSTGFYSNSANNSSNSSTNTSGATYIYIAIRRGPMKVPTDATKVFLPQTRTGTGSADTITGVGFPVDLVIDKPRNADTGSFEDRLRGSTQNLVPSSTGAETTSNSTWDVTSFASMDGISVGISGNVNINTSGTATVNWFFRRAPSFFDEVCYTGTGSATTVTHNLGVVPELMIVKNRSSGTFNWAVYSASLGASQGIPLNTTDAAFATSVWWNNTSPTSSVFSVGTANNTNASGNTYVAYLFATCAGVSKVGSYTGTGTTLQVNCGFTGGARFVLIKRTDSTGDWYVWDTARGIVSGNDPYLLLNSTAAEVTNTDYIDTYSAGFEISSTAPAAINASGGTFIFLAIA